MFTDRYFLNNKDMYLEFGFVPGPGCMDTIMQEHERKEPYSNDWPEHNGREFDLLAPVRFKERQFKLIGTITADSYSDYLVKKEALKTELYSGVCDVNALVNGINYAKDTGHREGYIEYLSGQYVAYPTGVYVSDFVPVIEGRKMTIRRSNLALDYVMEACFYTSNDENAMLEYWGIPTGKPWSIGAPDTFIVPAGAKFMRSAIYAVQYPWKLYDWTLDLKCNAITKSISVNRIVDPATKPFLMPIEIDLTEVFL